MASMRSWSSMPPGEYAHPHGYSSPCLAHATRAVLLLPSMAMQLGVLASACMVQILIQVTPAGAQVRPLQAPNAGV